MASLELKHFSAYYQQKDKTYLAALNNIDFVVDDGDFVVIIGPSGCGKTTLLKSVLGFVNNTDGTLLIDQKVVNHESLRDRRIGYISQSFDLYKTKTVFENIAFPLRMLKVDSVQIKRRVEQISEELGLTILLTRKPRHLSIGQQQKVAIARALVKHPRILLFDEPFSNLDVVKRESMRQFIRHIHDKYSITTLFVTHQKDDAIKLANKIAIMKFGSIIYYNDKQDLLMKPENEQFRTYLYGE